jgi:lysophospholipase L1-like esterase
MRECRIEIEEPTLSRRGWTTTVTVVLVAAVLAVGTTGVIVGRQVLGTTAPPPVYVAVGASESVGVGSDNPATDAWPRVLLRTAFPAKTAFHDLAVSGATVPEAIRDQLPKAIALQPTVVTVWLNVNDITALEQPDDYTESLRTLVHGLRRGGATRVYVADTPPVEDLPVVKRIGVPAAIVRAIVDRYNAAIRSVCDSEGAVLVSLHAAGEAAVAADTFDSLVGPDGFHPSTAGHRAVAATFAAAING